MLLSHKMTQPRGFFCLGGGRGFSTALLWISTPHLARRVLWSSPDGLIENAFQITLGESGAFQILLRLDLSTDLERFLISYG